MTVYVVVNAVTDDWAIVSIHATREGAERAVGKWEVIEEWPVQD